jgi:type VI secretion system protein VasD
VLLAGCAAFQDPPPAKCEKLPFELVVVGKPMLNVNTEGQSMPVEVRAYFLEHRNAIDGSDFESVWQRAPEALGPSLLDTTTFTVFPGEEKITTIEAPPKTGYVAFVGLFRQVDGEQWRRIVDVRRAAERCRPGDLHVPVRASLEDNRVIAQERVE